MKTLYLLMFIPVISFAQMNQHVDRTTGNQYYSSFFTPYTNPQQVNQKDMLMWRQSASMLEKFETQWIYVDSMTISYDADNRKAEEYFLRYDPADATWKNLAMQTYAYGLNNEVVSVVRQIGTESGFENEHRNLLTYDTYGNLTGSLWQHWNGTNWEDHARYTFSYLGNLQTAKTIESFTNGAWTMAKRELYTYTDQGQLLSIVLQNNNDEGWANDIRYRYARTTAGYDVVMDKWVRNVWVPLSKEGNEMAGTQLQTYTFSTWANNEWAPVYRTGYSYNSSSLNDEQTKELYKDGAWENAQRIIITYNPAGQQTLYTEAKWTGDAWLDIKQLERTYDENGNMVMEQTSLWDGTQYVGLQRDHKYYESLSVPTGVEVVQPLQALKVFPNPFQQTVFIQFSSPYDGLAQLEIYNIAGERISYSEFETYQGHNQVAWDPGSDNYGLNEGVYIYSLTMGNEVVRGKLIYEE